MQKSYFFKKQTGKDRQSKQVKVHKKLVSGYFILIDTGKNLLQDTRKPFRNWSFNFFYQHKRLS